LKTLVLLESDLSKAKYSLFLSALRDRGHSLSLKSRNAQGGHAANLLEFGERVYDNLLVLDDSATINGANGYNSLLEFVDAGGNVLSTVGENASTMMRKFASRMGIRLSEEGVKVESMSGSVDGVVRTAEWSMAANAAPFSDLNADALDAAPLLFDGVALSTKKSAHLAMSLLSARDVYAAKRNEDGSTLPPEKGIFEAGAAIALAAATQTRESARVTFVGSARMLSNALMAGASANGVVAERLSQWTFGERWLIKVKSLEHFSAADTTVTSPTRYRIADEISVIAKLVEYRADCDCEVPFTGATDVELELIRLDAFHREVMSECGEGAYCTTFTLPDTFGVFKVSVDYLRRGLGHATAVEVISVRPFFHNEYDRFLSIATPYYAASFSMIAGFVVFTLAFVFGRVQDGDRDKDEKVW
jgi:oligosaccharyltransferase complex subunit beta